MPTSNPTDHDHKVWVQLFASAISGLFPAGEAQRWSDPALVKWCAELADAALEEERKRRR